MMNDQEKRIVSHILDVLADAGEDRRKCYLACNATHTILTDMLNGQYWTQEQITYWAGSKHEAPHPGMFD